MAHASRPRRHSRARVLIVVALVGGCGGVLTTSGSPPSPCASVACGDGLECCPTQAGTSCVTSGSCRTKGLTCTSSVTCGAGLVCCAQPVVGDGGGRGPLGEGGRPTPGDGGFGPPMGDGGFPPIGEGGVFGDGGFGGPPGGDGGRPEGGMGPGGANAGGSELESSCAATCTPTGGGGAGGGRRPEGGGGGGGGASPVFELCASDAECNGGTCVLDTNGLTVCQARDGG